MIQGPFVSIIIPVYNVLEYLPRCVDSICRQTYRNIEILLIDDGSTDGTGELCDDLAKEDSRIRVFHKKNGGSSSARNMGIRYAEGDYLGFVDSDDYIDADMYELLVRAVEQYGVKIAQVGRDEIDENGNQRPEICIPPEKTEKIAGADFLRELLMHRGDCSFCTKLVKKDLFEENLFPEGVLNEDFHLLIRLLLSVKELISLPDQSYHVFYRSGSNTRKADRNEFSRVFSDSVDNADTVQEIVDKNFPELHFVALRFNLYQRMEYLLHIPVEQMQKKNIQYKNIVSYIRKHGTDIIKNRYLTPKNKRYLILFAIAPKTVRKIHRCIMKIRR